MNWKNWPYWLRGGVIGGGVAVGATVLSCGAPTFLCVVLEIPTFPFYLLFPLPDSFYDNSIGLLLQLVVVIGIWFFLGSIMGGIVGYLKSKKKSPL